MSDFSSQIRQWREEGVIKYVKWHTVNDSEVCEVCRGRAEKEFLLSEIEKYYPAHEGCRCWLTPIVDMGLFEEQIQKILDEIPEEEIKEWREQLTPEEETEIKDLLKRLNDDLS